MLPVARDVHTRRATPAWPSAQSVNGRSGERTSGHEHIYGMTDHMRQYLDTMIGGDWPPSRRTSVRERASHRARFGLYLIGGTLTESDDAGFVINPTPGNCGRAGLRALWLRPAPTMVRSPGPVPGRQRNAGHGTERPCEKDSNPPPPAPGRPEVTAAAHFLVTRAPASGSIAYQPEAGIPIPNSGREGHQDGTPPREVQWFGTSRVTLVFPRPGHPHRTGSQHHTAAAGQPRP